MSSQPSIISHYRVVSKLGEGGMGAVYRATDTKLNRDVAIKVLPDSLAAGSDRLARFAREAQVLASLNHPNIAAIYGVEENALVMELVEGGEPCGPLAENEALPVVHQLIDALEYAHEKGVVHRDLKPANLKITPEGRLKVLDFGLAKAMSSETAAADPASSPTLTMRATMAGVILGTAAYMAPEQARGQSVDQRADIWAFGVVVHELLTGKQLFRGSAVSDILASVLRDSIDLGAVPARFEPLLRACLERDVRKRLRDIGDARLLLSAAPAAAEAAPPAKAARAPWAIAAVATVAALVLAGLRWLAPVDPPRAVRLTIPAPEKTEFLGNAPIVSPDGRMVVFVARTGDKVQLWLRDLGQTDPRPITGTEGASFPFWAPDSRTVAYFASRKLRTVGLDGAPPVDVCDALSARGGAWSSAGVIVFTPHPTHGLERVAASGGAPASATELDTAHGEFSHRLPSFLPDGRHFLLFSRSNDAQRVGVYAADLESKERRLVLPVATTASYASGHLLYVRDGTLLAQPFDTAALRLSGGPVPLAGQVDVSSTNSATLVSASSNGVIAYYSGGITNDTQLTWYDASGKVTGAFGPLAGRLSGWVSPDGRFVVEDRQDKVTGSFQLWIDDLAHGTDRRLTGSATSGQYPIWSPDSTRLLYTEGVASSSRRVLVRTADGSENATVLIEMEKVVSPTDWSRDGRYIVISDHYDIWAVPMSGLTPGKPFAYLNTTAVEDFGKLSPDGRWMAYESDATGMQEVYVQSFPEKHGAQKISNGGATNPVWSPDGRRLYFVQGGQLAMSEVKTGATFEYQNLRTLFPLMTGTDILGRRMFSVGPNGRILVLASTSNPALARLNVILNWTALLKR